MGQKPKTSGVQKIFGWIIVAGAIFLVIYASLRIGYLIGGGDVDVMIGAFTSSARIADTDKSRQRGLSGVKNMRESQSMLFVFDYSAKWGMHMKGMNFPIDIVWLDDKKRVVHVEKNAEPDHPPHKVYLPKKDSKYVLEIKSGTAEKYDIRPGLVAHFELEDEQ